MTDTLEQIRDELVSGEEGEENSGSSDDIQAEIETVETEAANASAETLEIKVTYQELMYSWLNDEGLQDYIEATTDITKALDDRMSDYRAEVAKMIERKLEQLPEGDPRIETLLNYQGFVFGMDDFDIYRIGKRNEKNPLLPLQEAYKERGGSLLPDAPAPSNITQLPKDSNGGGDTGPLNPPDQEAA